LTKVKLYKAIGSRPRVGIQNLAKDKVNVFKGAFVQMNFREELVFCLETDVF
jgi:hypothetical protein